MPHFLQENALVIIAAVGAVTAAVGVITIIAKLAMWAQEVNSDRDVCRNDRENFKDFMKEIREEIKKIHELLAKMDARIDNATISSGSPLHLTELGEKISSEIQARQWAEKTAAAFAETARDQQPYEIQETCFEYVREKFEPDGDLDSKIGMAAYESGITRGEVLDVLAIELRDVLMALAKQSA